MILGTAGHIDHGKTALVRALTGVDTDRLPEEKRRGITIELGFAPLDIEGLETIGVVDVPGHEAFVRTMLAGATGIDIALLVIAADEGVMPQTREHLAILDLLGVRAAIVALTKRDLVDDDWLELVADDARALVQSSSLSGAPIVACSAATGAGIDRLRAMIGDAAREIPRRDAQDLFRMPIDRAFTIKGTGTVATGTVWSGRLERDASVRLLPADHMVRVRGLQTHGASVDRAEAGHRTAIALAGVDLAQAGRGSVAVTSQAWRPSRWIRAEVALLDSAQQPLRARTAVRFHLGTIDVGARVVVRGGALHPGERRAARVVLSEPVVARSGDRFVLRSASPVATLGGGIVTDPLSSPRARPWTQTTHSAQDRALLLIEESGAQGLELASLPVRVGLRPGEVEPFVGSLTEVAVCIEGRLFGLTVIAGLTEKLASLVDDQHAANPLEPGVSLQFIRSRLGASAALTDVILRELVQSARVQIDGNMIKRAGWSPTLSDGDRVTRTAMLQQLRSANREPPSVAELEASFGERAADLLRMLEREGEVVQVEAGRYYTASTLDEMIHSLRSGMLPGLTYGPSELRELLGFSRKYLIPFLEYCDRRGLTARQSAGRVWRGT